MPRDFNRLDPKCPLTGSSVRLPPPPSHNLLLAPRPPQPTQSSPSCPSTLPPFTSTVMFPPPVGSLAPYPSPQVAGNLIAPSYPPPISQLSQISLAGLTLTVTAGEDISRVLRFDKSDTPVINIGRMPSSRVNELELDLDLDLDLAWFRCAVVSRKHAKICFADSGHVSILTFAPAPLVNWDPCAFLTGLSHRSILPSRHPLTQGRTHRPRNSRS